MATITRMFITEVGQKALWNSQSTGVDFEVTHIQLGSSNLNYGAESTSELLAKAEQTEKIQNGDLITNNQIRIFADIEGQKDYSVFEIGLWSGEPNKAGSVLFAYGVNKDTQFLRVSNGLNIVFSYDFIFTDHDVSNVKIIADNDHSRITAMLERHEIDNNAHPYYAHKEQDNTLNGSNTFTKPINADLSGNATTTNKLKTARTIALSGAVTGTATSFDGSANIVIPATAVDGSKVTGTVPKATTADTATKATTADTATKATTADTATKATTADTATKLTTARKIHGVPFDGTKDINIGLFSAENSGVVPQSDFDGLDGEDPIKFLREDGVWEEISLEQLNGLAKGEAYKDAFTNDVMYFGNANQSEGVEAYKSVDDLPVGRVLIAKGRDIENKPNCNGDAFCYIETKSTYFEDEVGRLQVAIGYSNGYVEMRSRGISNIWSDWAVMAFTTSNVASATKLQTARTIALSGAVTGTATSFDGSANITIPTTNVDATKLTGIVPVANLDGTYDISITGNSVLSERFTTPFSIGISGAVTAPNRAVNGGSTIFLNATQVDGTKVIGTVPSATHAITANTATTATKANTLTTARTINGTSFDGSANITTANWGTARNITIGNKTNSINGATAVSYSLEDIGALSTSGGTVNGVTYFNSTIRLVQYLDFGHGEEQDLSRGLVFYSTERNKKGQILVDLNKNMNFSFSESYSFDNVIRLKSSNSTYLEGFLGNTTAIGLTDAIKTGWHSWIQQKTHEGHSYAIGLLNDTLYISRMSAENLENGVNSPTHYMSINNDKMTVNLPIYAQNGVTGNATTATKLQTARKINNVSFDGSGDIDLIQTITTEVDLDTLITPQTLLINTTFGINKPTTAYGVLEVLGKGDRVYQRYTIDTDLTTYLRRSKSGVWSEWYSITPTKTGVYSAMDATDLRGDVELNQRLYLPNISKAQFQLVLLEENRLDKFESLISKITDAKIRRKIEIIYQSNSEFKRESELFSLIVKAKILTEKELDEIWEKAIKLAV